MMRTRQIARSLPRDTTATTTIEFAIIGPVLILFLLGFLDFGYWMYIRATAAGALESIARAGGVGGAVVDQSALQTSFETEVKMLAPNATFTWNPRNYYQFSGIGKPEKLVTDQNGNGKYDPGDCWEDLNGNGVYDTTPGRAGIGGADDIVYEQVSVTFPPLVSIAGFVPGLGGNHTSVLSTIVRRQPYAAQVTPAIHC